MAHRVHERALIVGVCSLLVHSLSHHYIKTASSAQHNYFVSAQHNYFVSEFVQFFACIYRTYCVVLQWRRRPASTLKLASHAVRVVQESLCRLEEYGRQYLLRATNSETQRGDQSLITTFQAMVCCAARVCHRLHDCQKLM